MGFLRKTRCPLFDVLAHPPGFEGPGVDLGPCLVSSRLMVACVVPQFGLGLWGLFILVYHSSPESQRPGQAGRGQDRVGAAGLGFVPAPQVLGGPSQVPCAGTWGAEITSIVCG